MNEIKDFILTLGKMIHAHLRFGNYTAAKELYADLRLLIEEMSHDEMVTMVNDFGVTHPSAGWLAKGWCDNNGIKNVIVEFETAGCIATPGEILNYRRSKKTWGNLVSISNDDQAAVRASFRGENALRMQFWLKASNPIRLKQTTRNELKLLLGPSAVSSAMRNRKGEFIQEICKHEAARIEHITGYTIGEIWSAIRNGSNDLVERLSHIPSRKREDMRKRGMFVSDSPHPQLDLFAA